MSHPDPLHDPENVYPTDDYRPSKMHAKKHNKMKGRVITGSWDGEPISRPKTFAERHGAKLEALKRMKK